MGGDAILHLPGNSTRIDYISRAFRTGRHSKFHINGLQFNCEVMYRSSASNVSEVLQDATILALSRNGQGQQLDPFSALRQAESIINHSGALPPPNNVTFRLVWFTGRDRWYYNQCYIRFEFPPPDLLRGQVAWDRSLLLEDLELSEGQFVETEPTIVKLWGSYSFFFVCFLFNLISHFLQF